jgi:hypothetical protein
VVVRGIGSSLTGFAAGAVLADPVIELFNAQGQSLGRNDNWADAPEAAQITAAGLAPRNAKEAALLRTLSAGSYTAIVSGRDGTSGIGLAKSSTLIQAAPAASWQTSPAAASSARAMRS